MTKSTRPSRRSLLRGGAALGATGALGALTVATGAPTALAATTRKPVIVGANPGVQLFDASGASTAFASVWKVDWSVAGAGRALMLWTPEGVTIGTDNRALAAWLWERYTSLFPELEGLPVAGPRYHRQHVSIELDLVNGLVARAGGICVRIDQVLDRRWVDVPDFTLGDRSESLNFVLGPCARGTITRSGRAFPGAVSRGGTPERPSSSAYLSQAEVWQA